MALFSETIVKLKLENNTTGELLKAISLLRQLDGGGDSVGLGLGHMKCTPNLFSLTVSHRKTRPCRNCSSSHRHHIIATFQMMPQFFTLFHILTTLNSTFSLLTLYHNILEMQQSHFTSLQFSVEFLHLHSLLLQFWDPREESRLAFSTIPMVDSVVLCDVGEIDLTTFVSIDSSLFRRFVTRFNGYIVRIIVTNSYVRFFIGFSEIILTDQERQSIIEGVTSENETHEFQICLHPMQFFYNMSTESKRVWFFKTTNLCYSIVAPLGVYAQFQIYFPPYSIF